MYFYQGEFLQKPKYHVYSRFILLCASTFFSKITIATQKHGPGNRYSQKCKLKFNC